MVIHLLGLSLLLIMQIVVCREMLQLELFSQIDPVCQAAYNNQEVIGGAAANMDRYPYLISLQVPEGVEGRFSHRCGGVLIGPTLVLTAGHCIYTIQEDFRESQSLIGNIASDKPLYAVRNPFCRHQPGDQDERILVKSYFINPQYTGSIFDGYDIAILTLEDPFSLYSGPYINYADTASIDLLGNTGQVFKLVGWGAISSQELTKQEFMDRVVPLQEADLKFLDDMICTSLIQADEQYKEVVINAEVELCFFSTDGADSCIGDSGGPIIYADELEDPSKDIIIGITSWGPNKLCDGSAASPGVYTKISAFLDWIQDQVDLPGTASTPINGQQNPGSALIDDLGLSPPVSVSLSSPQDYVSPPRFPTTPPSDVPERCKVPADRGPCEGNILSYYYDSGMQVCTTFMWGGCGGNENNFVEKQDCEVVCLGTK